MDPKELIAALGVFADPNASDEDKAAALDKLTAYFNSLLDAQEAAEKAASEQEQASEQEAGAEAASEAGEGADDDKAKGEPSKEMASALAQIAALNERIAKMEKASALGRAPRAKFPTVLPRKEPAAPKDHVVSMIEAAERNTIRNLSK